MKTLEAASGRDRLSTPGDALETIRRLLSRWRLTHLRVHGTLEGAIDIPFPGSLFRGALGDSLYRLVCVKDGISCDGCPLRRECLYTTLFDPQSRKDAPSNRGSRVRPFALLPPARLEGGPTCFDLKLVSIASDSLPHLLRALVEMGKSGLGRERRRLAVSRIESLTPSSPPTETVLDAGDVEGISHAGAGAWSAQRIRHFGGDEFFRCVSPDPPPQLRLRFLTPLRMKDGGHLRDGFAFERILRAALRRLTALGELLDQEWPRAWPSLLERARSIRTVEERTRWLDWGRYSRRQGRGMRLGGAVGEAIYDGVPGDLLPLLRTAAFLHLGKNVTFGLGAVEVEP